MTPPSQRWQHAPALHLGIALSIAALTFSNNPVLALLALVNLFSGIKFIWWAGEYKFLIFMFIYQLLQVNTKTLYADLLQISVADLATFGGEVTLAVMRCIAALLVLAVGMNCGAGPRAWLAVRESRAQTLVLTMKIWVQLYLTAGVQSAMATALGMAFASAALMPAFAFESSITKVLPSLALSMLLSWMLLVFALPRLPRWATQPTRGAVRNSQAQGDYR